MGGCFDDVISFKADFRFSYTRLQEKRQHEHLFRRLGKQVKFQPQPLLTRWNAWFKAVYTAMWL